MVKYYELQSVEMSYLISIVVNYEAQTANVYYLFKHAMAIVLP